MFKAWFANMPLYSPKVEAANLRRLKKPIPPEFWKANSIHLPLGRESGRGWLLMRRGDLDEIVLNELHTLVFEDVEENGLRPQSRLYVDSLVIAREPLCLTPSHIAGDPEAIYLVEVADSRHLARMVTLRAYYNLRARPYTTGADKYQLESLNPDTNDAWTWDEMVGDIWDTMSDKLGEYEGLPFEPDGTPENWNFTGLSAWDALCDVLDRLGCAVAPVLALNESTGIGYSIVQVGAPNLVIEEVLDQADAKNRKIHDGEYLPVVRGKIPFGCRVFFNRMEKHRGMERTSTNDEFNWLTDSIISIFVDGPDDVTAAAQPGTYTPIWDDLPAIIHNGTLENQSDLQTRAQERTDDFFRMIQDGGSRFHRIYTGLVDVAPCSILKAVSFRQDFIHDPEGALVTEVVRHPFLSLRMGDDGKWGEVPMRSAPNQAPMYGPQLPIYPELLQWVQCDTNTPDSAGRYAAHVIVFNPETLTWIEGEACWLYEVDGVHSLIRNVRYLTRMNGYSSGRPLYLCKWDCCTQGSGSGSGSTGAVDIPDDYVQTDCSDEPIPGEVCLEWSWGAFDYNDYSGEACTDNLPTGTNKRIPLVWTNSLSLVGNVSGFPEANTPGAGFQSAEYTVTCPTVGGPYTARFLLRPKLVNGECRWYLYSSNGNGTLYGTASSYAPFLITAWTGGTEFNFIWSDGTGSSIQPTHALSSNVQPIRVDTAACTTGGGGGGGGGGGISSTYFGSAQASGSGTSLTATLSGVTVPAGALVVVTYAAKISAGYTSIGNSGSWNGGAGNMSNGFNSTSTGAGAAVVCGQKYKSEPGGATGDLSITITTDSTAEEVVIQGYYIEGLATNSKDTFKINFGTGANPNIGSMTTSSAAEFLMVSYGTLDPTGGEADGSHSSGWTDGEHTEVVGKCRLCEGYQITTSAGSYSASKTGTPAYSKWAAGMVGYR